MKRPILKASAAFLIGVPLSNLIGWALVPLPRVVGNPIRVTSGNAPPIFFRLVEVERAHAPTTEPLPEGRWYAGQVRSGGRYHWATFDEAGSVRYYRSAPRALIGVGANASKLRPAVDKHVAALQDD